LVLANQLFAVDLNGVTTSIKLISEVTRALSWQDTLVLVVQDLAIRTSAARLWFCFIAQVGGPVSLAGGATWLDVFSEDFSIGTGD